MKKQCILFVFPFLFLFATAQSIETIVPKQPVVIGNAFQVQYIITEPSDSTTINTPAFNGFRLVSGPNRFKGTALINGKMQQIENITFTVVPLKTGAIKIEGLLANFKTGNEKSNDAIINVIPQPKASFNTSSSYTDVNLYAPSSKKDINQLIDENLFVKVDVDKHTCFLGEPVVATFKLYSRLQSSSEVLNAPALYGFSVMDMLDINEAHQSVETINGKVFNTSVLRKLQLYPQQTGQLTIDEMQLQNEIEFDDSIKGKKLKVEKLLSSPRITINVKPLPSKEPDDFTGAVGNFSITAELPDKNIPINQQGKIIVRITGKGNFIQFSPPVLHLPKAFDVFDPTISETFNKDTAPTEGMTEYVYPFTADSLGLFVFPPVSFSFFDPAPLHYKTVHSDTLNFKIVPAGEAHPQTKKIITHSPKSTFIVALLTILVGLCAILIAGKRKAKPEPPKTDNHLNFREWFQQISALQNEKELCFEIQKLLSEIKSTLTLNQGQLNELQDIQTECQLLIYSDVSIEGKAENLKKRTEILLQQLHQ